MKQYITQEQLNELSDKGKDRLCKWWEPQPGDLVLDGETESIEPLMCCEDEIEKGIDFPLLSIGQMIEFLYTNENFYGIGKNREGIYFVIYNNDDVLFKKNIRFYPGEPPSPIVHLTYKNGNELADTLWWVVKTILEKE